MTETQIQQSCVKWFRVQYPKWARLLISIPNEGIRSRGAAQRMKAEGMVPGAADLILFHPTASRPALFLECKTATGRQSPNQKQFEQAVTDAGYRYELFRSLDEFCGVVEGFVEGLF